MAVDLMGPVNPARLYDDMMAEGIEPTLVNIAREVCRSFNITKEDFLSYRRFHSIVKARHAAYLLSRDLTTCSFPQIGGFYNRDHTTIMHGARKASAWIKHTPDYANKLAEIRALFSQIMLDDWPDET